MFGHRFDSGRLHKEYKTCNKILQVLLFVYIIIPFIFEPVKEGFIVTFFSC